MKPRIALVSVLLVTLAAVAYQTRAAHQTSEPVSLAAYVPQDALLTIQSPDFASLLHRWQSSPEAATWLTSPNHAVFENSRLYGRLTDAEATFTKAAGIPATDTAFLNQVAGRQSIFAWYDIGKLEFLYITRLPAAQANQTQLLQQRGTFERRHAGNSDFYLRAGTEPYSTVAFAQVSTPSGDLLLLATREDLIANALKLLAGDSSATSPVTQEPWFADASAALPPEKSPPALHMLLNLDRIAYDPHFQTYWIQRNITWTRQYRAAVSDLYLEPTTFREERALIPKSPAPDATPTDVTALAALAPPETGLFRALATTDPAVAVTAIEEKLLGAQPPAQPNPEDALDPTLDTPQAGTGEDLETRIDTPPPAAPNASSEALTQALATAHLDAVLTLGSAIPPTTLWVPIHSAVLLHAANPFDAQTLAAALQQTLRGSLTAANFGIEFHPTMVTGHQIFALTGPHPLFFAVLTTPTQGNLALLTDNQPLLLQLLENTATSVPKSTAPATCIAAFNHTTQRAPYARLTSLVDKVTPAATNTPPSPTAPAFFSQDIASLSTTFARLQSERLTQTATPTALRQTVLYQWQNP
jgi:hypothetical protein